jgi:hypothetical protein
LVVSQQPLFLEPLRSIIPNFLSAARFNSTLRLEIPKMSAILWVVIVLSSKIIPAIFLCVSFNPKFNPKLSEVDLRNIIVKNPVLNLSKSLPQNYSIFEKIMQNLIDNTRAGHTKNARSGIVVPAPFLANV